MSTEFRILGNLQIFVDDVALRLGGRRDQKALGVLLLRANRPVLLPELVNGLWNGNPPATAGKQVCNAVSRLRMLLGSDQGHRIVTDESGGYQLSVAEGELDALVFDAKADQAKRAAREGSTAEAVLLLESALGLWRGSVLSGLDGQLFTAASAVWDERRLTVLDSYHDYQLALGRHSEVTSSLLALVAEPPLRERAVAQLMVAFYRAGRQSEALALYEHTRALLAAELGLDPGLSLQQTRQAILVADPAVAPAPPASAPAAGDGPKRVIAGNAGSPVPSQLPASVRHFTGRTRELRSLTDALDQSGHGTMVIAVIHGTPGIGKTSLALNWSHEEADKFPDGQLYVNLQGFCSSGSPVAPSEVLRAFLDAFGVPAESVPPGIDAQAGLYRSLLAGKRVLIVLDNARDTTQVRPLLPGSPTCFVVVTSRTRLTGLVATEGAQSLTLEPFSTDESRELLTRHLGYDRVAGQSGNMSELVRLCGGLPLALSLFAARVSINPRLGLSEHVSQLRKVHSPLDALDMGDSTTDVRTTFSWSFQNLTDPAARIFRLVSLHPGPDFSVPAAASLAGLAVDRTSALLAELERAHLLTEYPAGRYSINNLLRAFAAERADSSDSGHERRLATHRLLDYYLHTAYAAALRWDLPALELPTLAPAQPLAIPDDIANLADATAWFRAEHLVLLAVIDHAARYGFDTHAWQLGWVIARLLDRQDH